VVTVVSLVPAGQIAAAAVLTTGTAAAAVGARDEPAGPTRLPGGAGRPGCPAGARAGNSNARLAAAIESGQDTPRGARYRDAQPVGHGMTLADGAAAASASSPDRAGRGDAAGRRDRPAGNRRDAPDRRDAAYRPRTKMAAIPYPGWGTWTSCWPRCVPQGFRSGSPSRARRVRCRQERNSRPTESSRKRSPNVRKHATGATGAAVTLCYHAGGIDVEVSDDGQASGGGHGHGIAGMRERAVAYGGSLAAGPGPSGGWMVRARLAGGR